MRIKRLSIESFGSVRNFHEELKDDMTVIYGPNEAGKSTIAEFIRTTLFPNKSRSVRYPSEDKSDCGSVEIQMDNGDTRTLKRKHRKVIEKDGKKTFDEEMKEFDLLTYSSIYGLDLKELTNSNSVSAEKVKSKFLKAMGGEHAPKICSQIEKKLDSLMNKERVGNKPIERLLQDRKETVSRIEEIEEGQARYDQCMVEKRELEDRIVKRKAQLEERERARKRYDIAMSHQPSIERYKGLVDEYEKDTSFINNLSPKDCDNYKSLKEKADDISSELNDYKSILVCERADEVEEIWKNKNDYLMHLEQRDKISCDVVRDEDNIKGIEVDIGWTVDDARGLDIERARSMIESEESRRGVIYRVWKYMGSYWILFVAFLAWVALIMSDDNIAKKPLAVFVGAYIVLFILLTLWNRFSASEWYSYLGSLGLDDDTTSESVSKLLEELCGLIEAANKLDSKKSEVQLHNDYICQYEGSVKSFLPITKTSNSIPDCVKEIHDILIHARRLTADRDEAHSRLSSIFNKYGGEEQFNKKCEVKKNLGKKFLDKENLRKDIELSTNMPIDDVVALINSQVDKELKLDEENARDNRRIGELNKEIDSMMNDNEIVDLRVKLNSIETELKHELYEWAVNSLAKNIMDEAISCLDSDIQPIIREKADYYLSAMTSKKYRLSSDPIGTDLSVEDNFGEKGSTQWSSGLSDQVYLSIKMAIAQGISSERIPMIMDDVLVKFDIDRKKAACDVISEFSKVNQVILFTCDNFVRDYFKNKNCGVIDLSL